MAARKSQGKWTDKELTFLKENWGEMGGKVCKDLSSHSESAVRQKAKELGLKRTGGKNSYWSSKEVSFLLESAGELPAREIAEMLKRPESTVFWKLSALRRANEKAC